MDCNLLSQLPQHILDTILADVDINSLLWLVHQLQYSDKDRSLRMSIVNRISKLNIAYTNRIKRYTYLGMYLLTESYINKQDLCLIRDKAEVLTLVDFGLRHHNALSNLLTLSYYIWDLSDFHEFMSFISDISAHTAMKLNLEIELDPGLLEVIDFNIIVCRLRDSQKNHLINGFMVTNYSSNHDCEFRAMVYPNLQNLWVINSHFSNTHEISSDSKIVNLKISPHSYGAISKKPITVAKNLPSHLKRLSLSHNIIVSSSLNYDFPTGIEHLSLTSINDHTKGQFIYELVKHNIDSLVCLHLENMYTMNSHYTGLLTALLQKRMHVFKAFKWFKSLDPNESLQFSDSLRHLAVDGSLDILPTPLPMSLTNLDLSNCNIDTFNCSFPPHLVQLFLSHNPIDWSNVKSLEFPPYLKRLELKNTGLSDIHKLQLPHTLETLALEVNLLESVDNYRFPASLVSLGLGSNRIKAIKYHFFPPSLTILHLTENCISSSINFAENRDNEKLNLFAVYLNNNEISRVNTFKFCPSLKVINFDENRVKELKDITFPYAANELSFYGCRIASIKNVDFNNCLNLDLGSNNLKSISHIQFPQTLQRLNLSCNKLSSIDPDAFSHCKLVSLNLSHNSLKARLSLKVGPYLEHLNLAGNALHSIDLHYNSDLISPDGSTNLKSLNVAKNKPFRLQNSNLGDKPPIKHGNLSELDLTETMDSKASIDIDTSRFPNLQALFLKWSGLEDELGCPIFDNWIQDSYCKGKRQE